MFFYNKKSIKVNSTLLNSKDLLEVDKGLVNKYLLEETCRRRQISLYLDSIVLDSCSSTNIACDLCFNRSRIYNSQSNRILESSRVFEQKRLDIQEFIRLLESYSCLYCSIISKSYSQDHTSSTCSIYSNIEVVAKEIKSLIKAKEVLLVKDSCCFKCLLPTSTCVYLKKAEECFSIKLIFRSLAILFIRRRESNLLTKYSLKDNITLKEFLKKFLSKIFIKELNIEGTLGFYNIVLENLSS